MRHLLSFVLMWFPLAVWGEAASLFVGSAMGNARGGMMAPRAPSADMPQFSPASLFAGRAQTGFFADRPAHEPAFEDAPLAVLRGTDVERIRALISAAESRRDGYDAVQHGARIATPKRPTQMTLAEIYRWIDDTPGQPHAIGRYQFIPATLRRVVAKTGVSLNARFTPRVQDRLADVLLAEAGLHRFRAGTLERVAFMNNLAKIWAGLPNSSGKSHYHGYAGNKASITWVRFDAEMAQIDPRG